MGKLKCHCKGCKNKADKLNSLMIENINGDKETYNICDSCLDKIKETFLDKKVKPKNLEKSTTEKEPSQTKKDVLQIVKNYSLDKLKEEYCDKNRSIREIAEELGINTGSLARYLYRNGIKKRKYKDREHQDSKEGS